MVSLSYLGICTREMVIKDVGFSKLGKLQIPYGLKGVPKLFIRKILPLR
jgi:hypothetical protein